MAVSDVLDRLVSQRTRAQRPNVPTFGGNGRPGPRIYSAFAPASTDVLSRTGGGGGTLPVVGNRILGPGGGGGQSMPGTPPKTPQSPQGVGSPLDSTFWLNVAGKQFGTNQQITGLGQQGANAATDLQTALSRLAVQQPQDQLRATQQANARGGLFSTAAARQMSNLGSAYANRQGDMLQGYERGQAGRQQQVSGLQGDLWNYIAQQSLLATERASQNAAKNPALGEQGGLPKPPTTPGGGGGSGPGGHGGGGAHGGPRAPSHGFGGAARPNMPTYGPHGQPGPRVYSTFYPPGAKLSDVRQQNVRVPGRPSTTLFRRR